MIAVKCSFQILLLIRCFGTITDPDHDQMYTVQYLTPKELLAILFAFPEIYYCHYHYFYYPYFIYYLHPI